MSTRSPANQSRPDFTLEDAVRGAVAGLDEVGRGPLAGPVVAACLVIPDNRRNLPFISEIRDSKKLSEKKLEYLFECIREHFVFGIAECSAAEIDELNILQASLEAMKRAYHKCCHPEGRGSDLKDLSVTKSEILRFAQDDIIRALVDGNKAPSLPCSVQTVVKGDSKSVSIAAASILAKVTRDRDMRRLAEDHPYYGWESNVGYPTRAHLDGINAHGITPHHRKTYAPIRNYLEFGSTAKPLASAV